MQVLCNLKATRLWRNDCNRCPSMLFGVLSRVCQLANENILIDRKYRFCATYDGYAIIERSLISIRYCIVRNLLGKFLVSKRRLFTRCDRVTRLLEMLQVSHELKKKFFFLNRCSLLEAGKVHSSTKNRWYTCARVSTAMRVTRS